MDCSKKILTRDDAASVLGKSKNKKIVFTNGCFDIIHIGHIRLLQEAKSFGDVLVVGLNSDNSVKRLKGQNRPIVCQEDRAEVLAALECVDFVVIFDEDTPLETIKAVKPAIHVKGGDYDIEKMPETPLLRSIGAEIKLVKFVDDHSSSSIISKILSVYR